MASWEIAPGEDAVERYYARLALPVRVIARELDALARGALPGCVVGIKWSVPFYARKGPVCYVSAARAHVTFGLLQGVDIPDGTGRLSGTGKSPIRKAVFRAGAPVPRGSVKRWLAHARRLDATWDEK